MNGGADDKRQRRIFAAFTAVTVFNIADGVTIFAGNYMMIRGALALKRAEKAGKTA